jgi:cysteine desulfurase
VKLCLAELPAEAERLIGLRQRLWERFAAELDDVHLNGHSERRLPGNLNVSFGGVVADNLLRELSGVALSTGSACSTASPEPSHVLRALGLSDERIRGALRFGLGRGNTLKEIDSVADRVIAAVRAERAARRPTVG